MAKTKKKYSHPELYEGYYWLILHTDPNVLVSSTGKRVPQIIPEFKFKYPMPNCIKTAIEAKTVMHTLSRKELDRLNKGLAPNDPFYASPEPYSTYEINDVFDWLLQDKNVLTLNLKASGKEIRSWEDLRELWKEADIPFQDLRSCEDFYTRVQRLVPVPDEDQYNSKYFYSLESYLARQHQKNLKRLGEAELKPQAGPGGGKVKTPQKPKTPETTLVFDTITGKFSFGVESVVICKRARARKRDIAKKFMEWWKKGKPCPQRKLVQDPSKKTPQGVYDDISAIRQALLGINVNMPQVTAEGYSPPTEPQNFSIITKKID